MSWMDIISNNLINFQSLFGYIYNNVLSGAIIIDFKGNICARTVGISINNEELKKLKELFAQRKNTISFIKLGGKKYRIFHYEQNEHAYVGGFNSGATIAKSNLLFIIGFYDTDKNFLLDGCPKPQSVGICNHVVEELAIKLKKLNF